MKSLRYLSVCSGIGSDAVAWHPLGWETAAFAEIDGHASAVLQHHFPSIPNHGDFTSIKAEQYGPVDLLAGGTPCQSFSVAGLRRGLDDDRGNLALQFCRLAERVQPRWLVWENVPGVLSLVDGGVRGGAFLSIVRALEELGYGVFWRVLDAQYVRVESHPHAVPQRRRRVFLVGYLGDWRPPVAILLEPESLRGDSPPRREAGQRVAPTLEARATAGGAAWGTDFLAGGGLVAGAVSAKWAKGTGGPAGDECYNLVAFSCKDHGADAGGVSPTLRAMPHHKSHANAGGQVAVAIQERAVSENPDNGPDGIGVRNDGSAYTLEARSQPQAVAFAENTRNEECLVGGDGSVAASLNSGGGKPGRGYPAVAVLEVRGRGDGRNLEFRSDGSANTLRTPSGGRDGMGVSAIHTGMTVRRITPLEAERLMGLPDGWTAVPYRGKPMADGPRYRLIGNGIAINCLRWIGERIALFEKVAAP